MLTQLSQSSKRFGKLKKYKSKLKQSGFQFLLQSLDRGKENYVPNAQLENQLVHSVQIDPLLTAPVHSSILNTSNILQNSKKGNFFLQNVKILDRSDASISETCGQKNSKKSKKYKDNSNRSKNVSKKENRDSNQLRSDNSGKVQKSVIEQLINKTKQYLTISNQLNSSEEFNASKRNKKTQKIQSELIALITNIEEQQFQQRKDSKLISSIDTTKFSICNGESSKVSKGNEEQYLKKITSLQYQKEKLTSLISQHEIANIKMFVKINQGESQEIQLYKKQLALLFEKYKKLQSIILSDKKKMNEILKEKQQFELKNKELTLQNTQLMKKIRQYQQQTKKRQTSQLPGQKHKKNGNLSSLEPHISHSREKSSQSIFESSINDRGELYLQSIINSDFQSENGFGSSITTYTSRQPTKGTKIGINLTSLFQSMKHQNLSKMIQDPKKIKKMLNECRKSIISLQNIINEQNKQLEYSLTALQQNSEKLKENQMLIKNLQSKIVTLTKSLEKQRQKNQQKIQEKLKLEEMEADRKKKVNENKFLKNSRACDEKELKKKNSCEDNKKVRADFQVNRSENDEYRIIALQAKALEKMLGNQNRFVNQ